MTDPTTPMTLDQPADQAGIPPEPTPTPAEAPPPPTADESESGAPDDPAAAAKRFNARALAAGGIALVIAFGGGAVIGGLGDDDAAKPVSVSVTSAAPSPTSAASTTAAPSTPPPTAAAPSPTKTTPPPKPPSYKTLSARQWKLIAKNPDAYLGKTYVVYGRVTQFDAATGSDTFRADVAHRRMADEWDYDTNTMLYGVESDLANLVEDDIFRANVTVLGSFSYDTQIGGETTVPLLKVDLIKVL
ncbi:hypothetical protein GA0070624_3956 [Micromonospora rhizosphaerae]|uniref:tRNA_anti-like n=1 Tax=Micromonospora rhizosphaerae TaxID=568872 RepID=A0A1C6SK93_9ACTN|nr:hypothetical protein [Micromonospora rhizosphaerae]SCL29813.1 hypothetical protein GA0070624_3956 [Micromonospora rhizosphaerae]